MNDLKELLDGCVKAATAKRPNYEALAKARELETLGFSKVAARLRDGVLLAEKLECVAKEGYLVITPKKIQSFLDRKAAEYDKLIDKEKEVSAEELKEAFRLAESRYTGATAAAFPTTISTSAGVGDPVYWWGYGNSVTLTTTPAPMPGTGRFSAMTHHWLSTSKTGAFVWTETPIESYEGVPPGHVLEALRSAQEKEIFHEFVIAAVNEVKDPLLLGCLRGCEDRYYLAQWGEDVALDDVI